MCPLLGRSRSPNPVPCPRPESELVLGDVLQEEEVEATPRQLEMLLEESNSASSNSSNSRSSRNSSVSQSVSPDSGLQLELQEVKIMQKKTLRIYELGLRI